MSLIVDGTTGVTFNDSSLQGAAASPYVLKNRIINGDMRIDQRNAGASLTPTTDGQYNLDRFQVYISQASKFSVQQNAGSVTPPAGFNYYAGITSLSSYTVGASDYFCFVQNIEGYNIGDFAWGTASAKTVTLSFWVRSSLTGTFGASIRNGAANYSFPFTYTISSANTWEQKTVTITAPTSGTWATTNTSGLQVIFGLGVGTSNSGTANAWTGSSVLSVTGAASVVGTNGATFYITGVQLEIGTSATPFERRLYNQELANCQRYYWMLAPNQSGNRPIGTWSYLLSNYIEGYLQYPVKMRTVPSLDSPTITDGYDIYRAGASDSFNAIIFGSATDNAVFLYATSGVSGTGGQSGSVYCRNTYASYVALSAEL